MGQGLFITYSKDEDGKLEIGTEWREKTPRLTPLERTQKALKGSTVAHTSVKTYDMPMNIDGHRIN